MKKIFIFIVSSLLCWNLYGQFNPIQNLYYSQTYEYQSYCPAYNCFYLSWNAPVISSDTLVGYNIYRKNIFWIFESNTTVHCSPYYPCSYSDFYLQDTPYWIKVKAVYNNSQHIESIATDSVQVTGIAINVDNLNVSNNFSAQFNNPIKQGNELHIKTKDSSTKKQKIKILNYQGQVIIKQEFDLKTEIKISTNNLKIGFYLIVIENDLNINIEKLIVI